ncbi:hypothetical protein [Calothrix sp. NIES-2098]|uniref:hypothetical protein n=1 Tax=Calothrix sp. NIES-2098 TaxID=1954171 RepID=UPI000B5DCC20|nr:hypothetical protein NIES2098_38140 [Calothrix sp. NIES-2098]
MDLSLAQCFGESATQSIDSLVITKSELPGLTPDANNTAESLVIGILLKILENFEGKITTESGSTITLENGQPLTFNQGDIANTLYLEYWRIIFRSGAINYRVFQLALHVFNDYP